MKKIKLLSVLLLLLSVAVGFTSCEDVFGNSVSGYYASETRNATMSGKSFKMRSVYNFVSDTEVVYYSMVANGKYWESVAAGISRSEPFPDHSGWYCQRGAGKTYSYTKIEDKVYITEKGVIFEIVDDGDGLIPEGGNYSEGYFKW